MRPLRTLGLVGALTLVLRQELRLMTADRTLWWTSAFLLILLAFGLYNGASLIALKVRTAEQIAQKQRANYEDLAARLSRIMAGTEQPEFFSNPASPDWVGYSMGAPYAALPLPPLASLALGQADLLPNYYKISTDNKANFLDFNELENPWHLLRGHLDLAFVLVYLLPLVIFAVTYNLLSGEREQGTLKILLSQPLALSTVVLGKIIPRVALIFLLVLGSPIAAILIMRADAGALNVWSHLLVWSLLVMSYGAFWFALAFVVNVFGRSSASNAMTLVSVWVVCVLVVPVMLNAVVSKLEPIPPRMELINETREATNVIGSRYAHLNYDEPVPKVTLHDGKVYIAPWMHFWSLVQKEVSAVTQPLWDRYDVALARQQALVDRVRFVSPAVVLYEAMSDLAGTGARRHRLFEQQVDAFRREWQAYIFPRIFSKTALTEADYQVLPSFTYREEEGNAVMTRALAALFGVLLPAGLLVALGASRLRRYPTV